MEKERVREVKKMIKAILGLGWEIIKLIVAIILVTMMLKTGFLVIAGLF